MALEHRVQRAFRKERTVRRRVDRTRKTHGKHAKGESTKLGANASLADYLTYAALNAPALEAAFYRWKGALEKIEQARALPDPVFSYTYYIRNVETRVGPQRHKLTLSQRLPVTDKLSHRAAAAVHGAHVAQKRYEGVKAALFFRLKKALLEYAYYSGRRTILRAHLTLLRQLEKLIRTLYAVKRTNYAAVIKVQVELARLEDRYVSLQKLRPVLIAELNGLLNRKASTPLDPPKELRRPAISVSLAALKKMVRVQNPQILAARAEVAQKKAIHTVAQRAVFPDIVLKLGFIETGKARLDGVPGSGKDPVTATIALRLPLWFGKYSAAVREASALRRRAVSRLEAVRIDLAIRLARAHFTYRDARRKFNLYRKTLIPKAEQAFEATQSAFVTGKSSFMELLDATRSLLALQLSAQRANRDEGVALARLELLVGRHLTAQAEKRLEKSKKTKGEPK
jgi:outer membrane protein TolC